MENLSFFRRGFERLVFLLPLFLDFDFFVRGIAYLLVAKIKARFNPALPAEKTRMAIKWGRLVQLRTWFLFVPLPLPSQLVSYGDLP